MDECGVCDGFGASCITQGKVMVRGGIKAAVEQCFSERMAEVLNLKVGPLWT